MKRLVRPLLWTLLFLLILVGIDQFFMRVPTRQPALNAVRHFYLDFRTRLFSLRPAQKPTSVEAVIEQEQRVPTTPQRPAAVKKQAPVAVAAKPEPTKEPSYFYADENGELQFADSLAEVPERFRKDAQRLNP